MDAGPASAAFSQLLQQLNQQHHSEVSELHKRIQHLQQIIEKGKKAPVQAPLPQGDSGDPPNLSCQEIVKSQLTTNSAKEADVDGLTEETTGISMRVEEAPVAAAPPAKAQGGSVVAALPTQSSTSASLRSTTTSAQRSRTMMLFDSAIGIIILANIVLMFVRLDFEGYRTAVRVGLEEPGKWPDMRDFFFGMQHLFCAVFLVEMIVRIAVFRSKYFYNKHLEKFNIFDATIVVFTCIDLYIIIPSLEEGSGSDLTVIRAMRFLRVLRAMRVVRTFEMFSKLRVLFATVAASFYALLWSMVLLFLTMLMAALILTQIVNPFMIDPSISGDTVEWMFIHYGTAGRSMWTVFEITFSGGWPNYARRLVEEASVGFAWFFAVYISTVVFAMTRIITALFLKDTLAVAANDAEMMIQEKTREKRAYAAKLLDFFIAADISGDGNITLDEFEAFLGDPNVKTYLATLELDAHETKNLFAMLDDGDGEVTAEEFVQGAIRLKGVARSQDVVSIMHDFTKMNRNIVTLQDSIDKLHSKLLQKI